MPRKQVVGTDLGTLWRIRGKVQLILLIIPGITKSALIWNALLTPYISGGNYVPCRYINVFPSVLAFILDFIFGVAVYKCRFIISGIRKYYCFGEYEIIDYYQKRHDSDSVALRAQQHHPRLSGMSRSDRKTINVGLERREGGGTGAPYTACCSMYVVNRGINSTSSATLSPPSPHFTSWYNSGSSFYTPDINPQSALTGYTLQGGKKGWVNPPSFSTHV